MSAQNNLNQESYEAVKRPLETNMFSIVVEDILRVAPEHVDTGDKVARAYHRAKEEVVAGYYEHIYMRDPPEIMTEGAIEWATAIQLWMKYCGRPVMICPAVAFRAECEEHMTRPDEAWLVYVAGRREQDGMNEVEGEEDEMEWE